MSAAVGKKNGRVDSATPPPPSRLPDGAARRRPARRRPPGGGWYVGLKAVCDFALAALLLVLTSPLLLAAVALVKLTSRGPAIYSQTRLGRNGKPFTIYKVRTMVHDCERSSGPRWSTQGDARVTPVGRFLRLTHLDELPQLWNVLRGDMSLVGPRPERPEFAVRLEGSIPHYRGRLLVRPGLTGLAQVQLPPDSDLDSVRLKLAYDLYYVHSFGFWLDLRLMAATGFYLLRVPFSVTKWLLRVPSGDPVERPYRALLQLRKGGAGAPGAAAEDVKAAPKAVRDEIGADVSKMDDAELEALAGGSDFHPAALELVLRRQFPPLQPS
jgi:lipopolysaccharide/colanic/teichoic acid biosynthesis glycosyltransferase